jgi:indole-3-acetate monooxygenase
MTDIRVDPVTSREIRAAVEDLLPEVARRADEIAAARRLPADLVADLRAAGAFRIALPRARGGPEMTPREQTELVEILSAADPSVGWCVMIGSDASFYGSFLDQDVAAKLFADPDTICAGLAQPAGRATVVDGGYEVSGKWAFGSGCTHADMMVAGFLVFDGDAPKMRADGIPEWRIAVAPTSSFEILDTWHTTGLAGSGSNDYTVEALIVPAEHTFSFFEPTRRSEPLYALPGEFLLNMPGVGLGLARRAIDVVRALSADKFMVPELVLMRDLVRVRRAVAQAEMQLGAARAYVYDSLDRVWAVLQAGEQPDVELRAALTLARANAFRMARDVVQSMCDAAGASSVYATSPLDRLLRDAMTLSQHIVVQERIIETVGGALIADVPMLPIL